VTVAGTEAETPARASYSEGLSLGVLNFAAVAVLGVVSSILIARIYGIQVMGQAALAHAPAVVLSVLSTVREQSALVRELSVLPARAPRITGLFVAVFSFSSALTVAVGALVLAGTYFIFAGPVGQPDLFAPAVVVVLNYVFLLNVSWNFDMVFSAFRAARQLFWTRVLYALTYLAVAVIAGLVWGTVWGLVFATVGATAAALAYRLRGLRRFMVASVARHELREGFRTLPELIRFGLKVSPATVAEGIRSQAGTWTLGVLGTLAQVGAWNRAWTLGDRLSYATNRITEMLLPTLVERNAGGDRAGFDRSLIDTLRYAMVGMLMAAAAGGGAAHGVMDLFGPGFDEAADALAIILLVPATATAGQILTMALLAVNRPGATSIPYIGGMVITIAGSIALTVWIGVTGTALGALAGEVVSLAGLYLLTRRALSAPVHRLWPPGQVVALLAAYAAGFGAARWVDMTLPGPPGLVVALGAGSLAYVAVFALLGGIGERDRTRLATVRAKRRARKQVARADAS
jgi:O-antigen/teichoic acid export membrane protein